MNAFKNIISIFVILLLPILLQAQPDLPTGEVEIIKNFDARLLDTEKLKVKPVLPPLDTTSKRLTYSIPTKSISLEYLPPKIRPVAMKSGKNTKSYKGFAKLGYGLPNSPYAEIGYRTFVDKKYNVGVHGKYHAANFKKIAHQRFSDLNLGLDGTYYMDQGIAVSGNLDYAKDEVYFYGVPETDMMEYTQEQLKQNFKLIDFGVKLFNGTRTAGDLNYEAGIDYYNLRDNYASTENGFLLKLGATKWIAEKHAATLVLKTDFSTFEDTIKQQLNNFFLQPSFTFHADAFKVKAGLNFASHNDKFFFMPDIEAAANIVGNQLVVFAGWKGDIQKNNFKMISDYNPFIIPRFELRNNKYNHIYGGIKGNIKGISYTGEAGFKSANNLAMYLNDDNQRIPFENIYGFQVVYDSVKIFNLRATIGVDVIAGLNITGTISQSVFDPKTQEKAWHLPATEGNFTATYTTLKQKLSLKGELYFANGVPYKNDLGEADKLNALFDISAGVAYQFTENVGAFFNVNNLAANKRQRWNRYPSYGLNLLAGITAKF